MNGVPITYQACARVLSACIKPLLAEDKAITAREIAPLLAGVNAGNFASRRPAISKGIANLLRGKLASDADPNETASRLLDVVHGPAKPASKDREGPDEMRHDDRRHMEMMSEQEHGTCVGGGASRPETSIRSPSG
jgi:hypothetical protein